MLTIAARQVSSLSQCWQKARLGDLQAVSDFMLDVIDVEGGGQVRTQVRTQVEGNYENLRPSLLCLS